MRRLGASSRRFLGIVIAIAGLGVGREAGAQPASFADPESAFAYLHEVAKHPRCVNCHGAFRADRQRMPTIGEARPAPHPMNVTARVNVVPQGGPVGIKCTSCHGTENSREPGGPPGAASACAEWQMPTAPSMTLDRGISKRELCRRWQVGVRESFAHAGNCPTPKPRSVSEFFVHHIEHDGLIAWAFAPGPARAAAPGSLEQLKAAARVWAPALENEAWCQTLKDGEGR